MSTGDIVASEYPYVGTLGPLGIQAGWAPNSFMQLNVSGLYSPFTKFPSYVTAGVKVRVAAPEGYFRGLAAGADFGLLYGRQKPAYRGAVQSYNLATSFGSESLSGHLNLIAFPYGTNDTGMFAITYLLQTGLSVDLLSEPGSKGLQGIAEIWTGGDRPRDIHVTFITAGVRSYDSRFVWELALAMGPPCFGTCGQDGLRLYPLPFAAVTFFF